MSVHVFNIWSCADFSALPVSRCSVESEMDKLTKAGMAHYMQYHVMRTLCSLEQVKDEICWSRLNRSRADDHASLIAAPDFPCTCTHPCSLVSVNSWHGSCCGYFF